MQTANLQKPGWPLEMETILQMLSVCNDFTSEVWGRSGGFAVERRQDVTHISLPIDSRPVYKSDDRSQMARARLKIVGLLVPALLSLLLGGIVAAEFPELLSLTDNTANDFTICKVKPLSVHDVRDAGRAVRTIDMDSTRSASARLLSHLRLLEEAGSLLTSEAVILRPVLRT
jgi:hypothetical protein